MWRTVLALLPGSWGKGLVDTPMTHAEPPLSAVASYAEAEFEDGEQQDEEEWPTNWADIRQAKREGAKLPASLSPDELQEVADKQGFGRFYAAFNGGERGLAACAAGELLVL